MAQYCTMEDTQAARFSKRVGQNDEIDSISHLERMKYRLRLDSYTKDINGFNASRYVTRTHANFDR